jgi:hypothetical protein
MARIIVTPDEQSDVVLLDENVYPVHLANKLSSLQVIERLAWAVNDAEASEREDPQHRIGEHEQLDIAHGMDERVHEQEDRIRHIHEHSVHI